MDVKNEKIEVMTRWALVAFGVVVLLRLKFVLFAAALPILAYWHYSGADKNEDQQEDVQAPADEEDDKEDFEAEEDSFQGFKSKEDTDIYGDEFWSDKPGKDRSSNRDAGGFSWDAGRDELDDLLADDFGSSLPKGDFRPKDDDLSKEDFGFGKRNNLGLGDGGFGDADFGLGLGPTDIDFGDRKERGEGKGKGKGKSKDKGKEPREADPKQVFVANLGDAHEDDIRAFFEQAGDIERLKTLRNPDGSSKGVGFVTFRTEEQAQKALTFHNRPFEGGSIVVRLAHAGNKKGEKGEKGDGRGDRGDRDRDGPPSFPGFRGDRDDDRDRMDRRPERSNGKGKGRGKGSKGTGDVDDALEDALSGHDGPLRLADFDFAARRFLGELRSRDRSDGGTRFVEAMDMVLKYTSTKDRSSVRKWTAYVFTLLQKFDPALSEEIRERDQERRNKGAGRSRMTRQTSDDD